jgi:replication-associated recombination protein RarA
MSLYQEIRPSKLEEIIGNQATVGSLKKIIRQTSSRPHTILLKGPQVVERQQ